MSLFSCSDLYQVASLRKLLAYYDIQPRKGLGQNFLFDKYYLKKINDSASDSEYVVEIGAGLGSLTCFLRESFDKVIAVEKDVRLKKPFVRIIGTRNVTLVNEDFLTADVGELGLEREEPSSLIGNIPYHLTSPIIKRAVDLRSLFEEIILTVQMEVAHRILADPGSRAVGPISFLVQAYAKVEKVVDIPADAFYPSPNVQSTTIKLTPLETSAFTAGRPFFFGLVRELFNYRRKTVRKGLIISDKIALTKSEIDDLLNQTSIDQRKRPEGLAMSELDRLARELEDRNGLVLDKGETNYKT